ncbi:MAG: hypothetical protein EDR02_01920 [Actinobacteria bacterium]|nr:MAG: hypothetical protein EDR02_01920 [Actinomycetota bacterium]
MSFSAAANAAAGVIATLVLIGVSDRDQPQAAEITEQTEPDGPPVSIDPCSSLGLTTHPGSCGVGWMAINDLVTASFNLLESRDTEAHSYPEWVGIFDGYLFQLTLLRDTALGMNFEYAEVREVLANCALAVDELVFHNEDRRDCVAAATQDCSALFEVATTTENYRNAVCALDPYGYGRKPQYLTGTERWCGDR